MGNLYDQGMKATQNAFDNANEAESMQENSRNIASAVQKGKAAKTQKSGSAADTAGSMMMSSGEPTTMAAGATLKVISQVAENRRQERQAAADNENARRSKLITALGNLGSGIGSTGMA